MQNLIDYATRRLEDACENGEVVEIRYWVGYLDALRAVERERKEALKDGSTAD